MDELIENELRIARRALEDLSERHAELRQACVDAVVEWRWARAGSDLQRPEPLYRERYGQPTPRLLEQPPAVPQDEQQYGYDADGNIVVTREYVGTDGFREELRVHRGETILGYRRSETGEPFEVNIARLSEAKIRSYVVLWPRAQEDSLHGWSIQRYVYDGDLVSEIHEDSDLA